MKLAFIYLHTRNHHLYASNSRHLLQALPQPTMQLNKQSLVLALLGVLLVVPAVVHAGVGDTFAADLSSKQLPVNGSYSPGKGTGAMTIVEQQPDLFLWELDVYRTGPFTSIQAVYNTPGTPVVYDFPFNYSSTVCSSVTGAMC